MRTLARLGVAAGCLLVFARLAAPAAAADGAKVEQALRLTPGWNAVFLEVTPEPADPEAVFGALPVASVWHWASGAGRVQFVRDPGEKLLDQPGWHVWFPQAAGDRSRLSNLHALIANRAYLVEVAGEDEVTLTLSGRPSLRRPAWEADSFNLTGFSLDPDGPPTFGRFFAPSRAHAGQAVYRLANGSWSLLEPGETMHPGEAFWIYTEGASDYAGPLQVELDYGDDLDFGRTAPERSLSLKNRDNTAKAVSFAVRGAGEPVPLSRLKVNQAGTTTWPDLTQEPSVTVPPGLEETVRLAVRRAECPGNAEGVLEITDGQGSRLLVPLGATVPLGAGGEPDHAGLWVGNVTVKAVTEAQIPAREEFTIPQPAGFWFTFKVLLHVDAGGGTRLLKEVIQMRTRDNGTDPVRLVLLTDDSRVHEFDPVTLVGGEPFSHRISTAGYDFEGQSLDLSGSFSLTGSLQGSLEVPADLPTNPFLHAHHPDHDNRDELDNPIANPAIMEVYRVARDMRFTFTAENAECGGDPGCVTPPDWGYTRMGGTYEETLTGLHRNQIKVAGFFVLRRVSDIAELNPAEVAP